jgi:ankyrin repeat protein
MDASKEGLTVVVRTLLFLGADPNARYEHERMRDAGATALSFAAANGRAETTAALLRWGADPNIVDGKGFTPLCEALKFGGADPETVSNLLTAGARVDLPDRDHSALGCVTQSRLHRAHAVQLLLNHGGTVNDTFLPGKPLFVEWGRCCPDLLAVLLDHGADVNMRSGDDRTALMHAAAHGWIASVRLLLSRGADPTLTDRSGRTALDLAREGLALSDPNAIRRLNWSPSDPQRKQSFQEVIAVLAATAD